MRCGWWRRRRWMVQEDRTVNLVSTDSRQVQGRTVAPTLHSPSLYPVRPAIATPFASNCRQTLGTSRLSLSRRPVLRGMDGWMNGVRCPPRTAVCIHPLPIIPLLSPVSPAGVLSDYSPSERRANNNPAMTCSLADHLRSSSPASSRFRGKKKRIRDASNERMPDLKPCDFTLYSLLYEL